MSDRSTGLPRPKPGTRGTSDKGGAFPAEKTCAWPKAPGAKGPKMNRVGGFHEVKVSACQDMADDIYGNGPAVIGDPVQAQANMMPGTPAMMSGDPRFLGPPIRDQIPPMMSGEHRGGTLGGSGWPSMWPGGVRTGRPRG